MEWSHNVFICHSWDETKAYAALVGMLDTAPGFRWTNLSIPMDRPIRAPDILPLDIRIRLKTAQVLLLLSHGYTMTHDWMHLEINSAQRYGIPVVAILPEGQREAPPHVWGPADLVVRWDQNTIVAAIKACAPPD